MSAIPPKNQVFQGRLSTTAATLFSAARRLFFYKKRFEYEPEHKSPQNDAACHGDDACMLSHVYQRFGVDAAFVEDVVEAQPEEDAPDDDGCEVDVERSGAEYLLDHADGDGVGGGSGA